MTKRLKATGQGNHRTLPSVLHTSSLIIVGGRYHVVKYAMTRSTYHISRRNRSTSESTRYSRIMAGSIHRTPRSAWPMVGGPYRLVRNFGPLKALKRLKLHFSAAGRLALASYLPPDIALEDFAQL